MFEFISHICKIKEMIQTTALTTTS